MNSAPEVHCHQLPEYELEWKNGEVVVTRESVFQLIRSIKDPEHDYTLEDLKVVDAERIALYPLGRSRERQPEPERARETVAAAEPPTGPVVVEVEIVPTIPHCSMVGIIGLSILYQLTRVLHSRYLVRVVIKPGSHTLDEEMTKQLADIERTYSAFLNPSILSTITALI